MKKSQPRTARAAKASGFTILELMIAVTVLAILMGVAVPSFNEMIRQNRLTTQTNDLLTAASVARSEAVKRGALVTLCPANAAGDDCSGAAQWSNGWLVITDHGENVGQLEVDADEPEEILHRWPAAAGQNLVVAGNQTEITYRGSGATTLANDTQFTVTNATCKNPNGQRTIALTRSGRTSVTRGDCG